MSHPEGSPLPPHLERSLKPSRVAPHAHSSPAPCPRPAARSSSWGSWFSGQSCCQHPARMSRVSMSARPRGSSRHHSWPGACWGWAPGTRSAAWLCSAASLSPRRGWEQHHPPPDGPPTHTMCLCLSVKAGVCPEPAAEEANCTMGCQSDGDCESTLKCCPAACGKACQEPNGNAPRVGASPAPMSRWLRGSRRSVAVWSWASPVLWLQHSRGALHGTPQDWAVLPWSSCPHSLGWCWPHSPLPPACSSVGSEHPWCC